MDILEVFKVLMEFFGAAGPFLVVLALYVAFSVRIVLVGHVGVLLRYGEAVKACGSGIYWLPLPWPLYRMRMVRVNLQSNPLPVVIAYTKDGLALRIQGTVLFTVTGPLTLVREVPNVMEFLDAVCPGIISRWVGHQTFAEARGVANWDQLLQWIRDGVKEAKVGVRIEELHIPETDGANHPAQELASIAPRVQLQTEALRAYAAAAVAAREAHPSAGLDPTLLVLAATGTPVSALATADQVGRLSDQLDELGNQLEGEEDTSQGLTVRSAVEHVAPSVGALFDAVRPKGE